MTHGKCIFLLYILLTILALTNKLYFAEINFLLISTLLKGNKKNELNAHEITEVSGGRMYSPRLFLYGFAAAVLGGAIAVAGMGTPITIGGAALAAEGAAAMSIGLVGA
jgi:hypothetical protein